MSQALYEAFVNEARRIYGPDMDEYIDYPDMELDPDVLLLTVNRELYAITTHMVQELARGAGPRTALRQVRHLPPVTGHDSAKAVRKTLFTLATDPRLSNTRSHGFPLFSAWCVSEHAVSVLGDPGATVDVKVLADSYFSAVKGADIRHICILLDKLRELR